MIAWTIKAAAQLFEFDRLLFLSEKILITAKKEKMR